jgi:dCTP deaminase
MVTESRPEMMEPGTLSDREILEMRNRGLAVIEPFNSTDLGINSYDVRLGEWFYREQGSGLQHPIDNIYDERYVKRTWGSPELAQPYAEHIKQGRMPPNMVNIESHDLVFLLPPGATVLGHTQEYVGGRVDIASRIGITTKMHCRSSMGRSLLGVCKCSGFGDVGFVNRWTMEITSFSQNYWIPLIVGRRIAQIEFVRVNNCVRDYGLEGKYQQGTDLDELQRTWNPEMMLPRLSQDRDLPKR